MHMQLCMGHVEKTTQRTAHIRGATRVERNVTNHGHAERDWRHPKCNAREASARQLNNGSGDIISRLILNVFPSFILFEERTHVRIIKIKQTTYRVYLQDKDNVWKGLWLTRYVSIFKNPKFYLIRRVFLYSGLAVEVNLSQVIGKRHAKNKHATWTNILKITMSPIVK
jgi:hypothetical protein